MVIASNLYGHNGALAVKLHFRSAIFGLFLRIADKTKCFSISDKHCRDGRPVFGQDVDGDVVEGVVDDAIPTTNKVA